MTRIDKGRAIRTANTSSANESSRGECALPLTADVVGLPGEDSRDVGVAASGGEENAKVTSTNSLREAKAAEANQHKAGVGDDERRADAVLVGKPGEQKCHDCREDVWRGNQALRVSLVETHAYLEDDRQEVGDGVRDSCREAKEGCKGPYLEVGGGLEILANLEFLQGSIMTILFDGCDNEVNLFLVQELRAEADMCCLLREVDNGEVCADSKDTCDKTPEALLVMIVTLHEINETYCMMKIQRQPARPGAIPLGAVGLALVGP